VPYVLMILGILWFCDNAKLVEPTGYTRDLYGWLPARLYQCGRRSELVGSARGTMSA